MNVLKVAQTFATEEQALDYWVKLRWPKVAFIAFIIFEALNNWRRDLFRRLDKIQSNTV
jgi:hypothetical protein